MTQRAVRIEVLGPDSVSQTDLDRQSPYVRRWFRRAPDVYRAIVKGMGAVGRDRVLDLGCGFGRWSLFLAEANRTVAGLDRYGDRVAMAGRLSGMVSLDNMAFAAGEAERLPYRDASFDVVWCWSTLHFTRRGETLDEVRRVLKADGRLIVGMYYGRRRLEAYAREDPAHHRNDPTYPLAPLALDKGSRFGGAPNYGSLDSLGEVLAERGLTLENATAYDAFDDLLERCRRTGTAFGGPVPEGPPQNVAFVAAKSG